MIHVRVIAQTRLTLCGVGLLSMAMRLSRNNPLCYDPVLLSAWFRRSLATCAISLTFSEQP
jgi:hypothetical protein